MFIQQCGQKYPTLYKKKHFLFIQEKIPRVRAFERYTSLKVLKLLISNVSSVTSLYIFYRDISCHHLTPNCLFELGRRFTQIYISRLTLAFDVANGLRQWRTSNRTIVPTIVTKV